MINRDCDNLCGIDLLGRGAGGIDVEVNCKDVETEGFLYENYRCSWITSL